MIPLFILLEIPSRFTNAILTVYVVKEMGFGWTPRKVVLVEAIGLMLLLGMALL